MCFLVNSMSQKRTENRTAVFELCGALTASVWYGWESKIIRFKAGVRWLSLGVSIFVYRLLSSAPPPLLTLQTKVQHCSFQPGNVKGACSQKWTDKCKTTAVIFSTECHSRLLFRRWTLKGEKISRMVAVRNSSFMCHSCPDGLWSTICNLVTSRPTFWQKKRKVVLGFFCRQMSSAATRSQGTKQQSPFKVVVLKGKGKQYCTLSFCTSCSSAE